MMWVVVVRDKDSGETQEVFGPYRQSERALRVRDLLRDPYALTFRGDEEYAIDVMPTHHLPR